MNDLIQVLLSEFKDKFATTENNIPRSCQFPELPNKIKVAIGMRRVGKTHFIFQTIRQLIDEQHIPWQCFLYLNFEDDRLLPCSQQQFRELLESFYQLYPQNHQQTCYLFLDEIQNVEEWALVIRRFFDSKNVQIFLTGSSAKLLSKEIATSLRGRSFAIEIWPYSFSEYLLANKVPQVEELFNQSTQDLYQHYLCKYIEEGGFPEIIAIPQNEHRQVLQDYTELVILRDIVDRYHITNISLLKYLIKTLLKNVGSGFSVHKFANDIKSQGFTGAKNTIYDYLSYIEDAYLAFFLPLYSESIRKTLSNPRKIYAIDSGLIRAYSFSLNKNYGHLFENLVFLDLKRQGHQIHYYLTQNRFEVDFLTEDRQGKRQLFQVVWDTSDQKTLEREIRALDEAKQELNIEGQLITPQSYVKAIWAENRPNVN